MPSLDFKEVAIATAGPQRDQFELFARDFLEFVGFRILVGPDRGADAGRDLVAEETRTGPVGETRVKWLVSCKHKAHSGASVTADDESDIHDRVRTHGCAGFIGFYSTLPSSGLASKLNAPNLGFEVLVFDAERIEAQLLRNPDGCLLAQRFFPVSFERWKRQNHSPADVFSEPSELRCLHCGADLLNPKVSGILVVWRTMPSADEAPRTEHVYWCCKGSCDRALGSGHRYEDLIDAWEDLPDLIIPVAYIRCVMALLNQLSGAMKYSDEAFQNYKRLLLSLFPHVARHVNDDERQRMSDLSEIPYYLGGFGYEG